MKQNNIFHSIFILSTINKVLTVPVDYCLQPFNRSDCHQKPTAVFYYYKPGSRCEIEMWRGCPTPNKFDNEYDCSQLCIFRSYIGKSDNNEDNIIVLNNMLEQPVVEDTCIEILNTDNCLKEEVTVYTYKNNRCIPATWRGCASGNKFADEALCTKTCVKDIKNDWEKELLSLNAEDIKNIDNILDDFSKKDDVKEKKKMKAVQKQKLVATEKTILPTTHSETTTLETTTLETTTLQTTPLETTTLTSTPLETTKPETTTLTSTLPETTTLKTTLPETTTLTTTLPETTTLVTTKLETTTLTTTQPETTTLTTTQPVTTTLRTTTPESTTLPSTQPETTTLEATKPETTTLETTKPETTTDTEESATIDEFQEVVLTRDGKKPKEH